MRKFLTMGLVTIALVASSFSLNAQTKTGVISIINKFKMEKIKVLELFAGSRSIGNTAEELVMEIFQFLKRK